jgi:hypothetical protein
MEKKKVIKELHQALCELGLEPEFQISNKLIAEYLFKQLEILTFIHKERADAAALSLLIETSPAKPVIKAEADNSVNDFVDEMYDLYPAKCPKRNASTGKSHKDKDRIKRLLKIYTQDEIEKVIRDEVDNNFGVNYMKNFSTFLNNFPAPISESPKVEAKKDEPFILNGVVYQ